MEDEDVYEGVRGGLEGDTVSVVSWLLVRLRQAGSGEVGEARRHPTAEEE